jgi:hypothetical protein
MRRFGFLLFFAAAQFLSAQETIHLANGCILKGQTIARTSSQIIFDIGFTRIKIPINQLKPGPPNPNDLPPPPPKAGTIRVDANFQVFQQYIADLQSIVQERWDSVMTLPGNKPKTGTHALVRFQMTSTGEIKRILRLDGNAGQYGLNAAVLAIQTPAPFPPWSPAMLNTLGQTQILTLDFVYQ